MLNVYKWQDNLYPRVLKRADMVAEPLSIIFEKYLYLQYIYPLPNY